MRLTNDIRNTIIEKAMAHRFGEADEAHAARRARFAERLYEVDMADEAVRVENVHPRWYEMCSEFRINHPDFEPAYRACRDGKEDNSFTLITEAVFPINFRGFEIGKKHPMYDYARALAKAGQELRKERAKVEQELRNLLNSFGTVKTLFEAWPEGEQFLAEKPISAKSKALVPAELAARVNSMLGLEPLK